MGGVSFSDVSFNGRDKVVQPFQCVVDKFWLQTFVSCPSAWGKALLPAKENKGL